MKKRKYYEVQISIQCLNITALQFNQTRKLLNTKCRFFYLQTMYTKIKKNIY